MTKHLDPLQNADAWDLLTSRALALDAPTTGTDSTSRRDPGETQRRTDKLRALSVALVRAEERERAALAQDLHDDLGQLLAVVALKVSTIQKLNESSRLDPAIADCVGAMEQANRKIRSMALQLAPSILDQHGFVDSLQWLAEELQRAYGLDVTVENWVTPLSMDPVVAATLLRAVRELLVNVFKHALVTQAVVSTAAGEHGSVVVSVTDCGTGFDTSAIASAAESAGFGLLGIRERLGFLGGTVEIRSKQGFGTCVTLRVPLLLSDSIDARQGSTA
jgi:signal transduction histidine kinase